LQREDQQQRRPQQMSLHGESTSASSIGNNKSAEDDGDIEDSDAVDDEDDKGRMNDDDDTDGSDGGQNPHSRDGVDAEFVRMRGLLDESGKDSSQSGEIGDKREQTNRKRARSDDQNTSSRTPGFDVGEGRSIFVRNIPFDAGEQDLRETLRSFGKIRSVKFVADRKGEHDHRGSAFVQFADQVGAENALAAEADADRKLKELSAVVRKSDQRELPAVDGFGISLKGRRLVIKQAVAPDQIDTIIEERKPGKGAAKAERRQWMHLLHVGEIREGTDTWDQLSKSEQRQRQQSAKERKFRVNNPNFVIDPLRLSIRNLPTAVDVSRLQGAVVKHLREHMGDASTSKQDRRKKAQASIIKASLVRDSERRNVDNSRRSRGFGFIAFNDHQAALKVLEFLNNNPKVFGGTRRPIVEFAIEDKRKLRMQQDLYRKHAHKVLPPKSGSVGASQGEAGREGKDQGSSSAPPLEEAAEQPQSASQAKDKKRRCRWKPGESRGRMQRERRRAERVAQEAREQEQTAVQAARAKAKAQRALEREAERPQKRSKRHEPDAGLPLSGRKQQKQQQQQQQQQRGGGARASGPLGRLADDFELKAMERFRQGGF